MSYQQNYQRLPIAQNNVNYDKKLTFILDVLFQYEAQGLSKQPELETLLQQYFDVLLKYFIQSGIVPISSNTIIGLNQSNAQLYYQQLPFMQIDYQGVRRIIGLQTIPINAIQVEVESKFYLNNFITLVKNTQYANTFTDNPFSQNIFMKTPNIHKFGVDDSIVKQMNIFTPQDNRVVISLKLFKAIRNYTTLGFYWYLQSKSIRQQSKTVEYSQKYYKKQYKSIKNHIYNFLKQAGIKTKKQTSDPLIQISLLIQRNLIDQLIINQGNPKIPIMLKFVNVPQSLQKYLEINRTYDYTFLKLKQLYLSQYGFDIEVSNCLNMVQLSNRLGPQLIEILKQKLYMITSNKVQNNCQHNIILSQLDLPLLIQQCCDFQTQSSEQQYIDFKTDDYDLKVPVGFIECKLCQQPMVCGHMLLLQLEATMQQLKQFYDSNFNINKVFSYCKVCGEILQRREQYNYVDIRVLQSLPSNYGMYTKLFRSIIKHYLTINVVLNTQSMFFDYVSSVHAIVNDKFPQSNSSQINFENMQLQLMLLTSASYFSKISNTNMQFDIKQFYESNQKQITFQNGVKDFRNFKEYVEKYAFKIFPAMIISDITQTDQIILRLKQDSKIGHFFKKDPISILNSLKDVNNVIDTLPLYYHGLDYNKCRQLPYYELTGEQIYKIIMYHYVNQLNKLPPTIVEYHQIMKNYAQHMTNRYTVQNPFVNTSFTLLDASILSDIIKQPRQQDSAKFIVKWQKIKPIQKVKVIGFEYDQQKLVEFAIQCEFLPLQVLNFCGFSDLDYQLELQIIKTKFKNISDQWDYVIKKQLGVYMNLIYPPPILGKSDYRDHKHEEFKFLNSIQYPKDIFRNRLSKINYLVQQFVYSFSYFQNQSCIITYLHKLYRLLEQQDNYFIQCQHYISILVQLVIPQIKNYHSQQQIINNFKHMINSDMISTSKPIVGVLNLQRGAPVIMAKSENIFEEQNYDEDDSFPQKRQKRRKELDYDPDLMQPDQSDDEDNANTNDDQDYDQE